MVFQVVLVCAVQTGHFLGTVSLTDLNVDELENLCIEIRKPNSKPFIVVNWYRPPNSPIGLFSHLENLIARLDLACAQTKLNSG